MFPRGRWISVSTVVLALGICSATHAAAVGRTAGAFSVSNTGAATYTIPIWAPPGPNGIQPNIALVYNSQSGNGYVGVGWNLAGLSAITRCNLTYAQDAAPEPVTLKTSDGYCLDGQRLRLTSGTYGAAGSTYQTEIANFKNVTAYGTAGNGPSYFVVQTPDGHTYQYGNGGNSQVLIYSTANAWMLDEVSDPSGNTMTISYSTATGTVVPSTISWTPTAHGASTYSYTMQFNYGTNVLPTAGYVAGGLVQNPNLLSSITVNYSGTQVKEYVLTYQVSGTTGRDELVQVQECAASTSNCLNPTTIGYQSGAAGVATTATTAISSPLPSTTGAFSARYDFNGDGYMDLIYEVGTTWYVAFGSASGYGTPVSVGIAGGSLTNNVLPGDLVGAGKAGILANHSGTWYYYTWNGSSFVSSSTGLAFDTTAVQFALADINGDGLPDILALYNSTTSASTSITTRLNTSAGGVPSFSSSTVAAFSFAGYGVIISPDSQTGNIRQIDFNGDGRQDLVVEFYTCLAFYQNSCAVVGNVVDGLVAQDNGTLAGSSIAASYTGAQAPGYEIFANFDNDACTDFALPKLGQYQFFSCSGTAPGNTGTATYPVVAVMDWNGDGKSDLIENNSGTLYVQLSTATGLGPATATSIPYNSHCTYIAFDANGDGLEDLGCLSSTAGTSGFTYYTHNGANTPPDLVNSITDAFGNSVAPAYSSIIQNNYVAGTGTYPDVPYIPALYVATTVTYSSLSSAGGTYNQTFTYYGSQQNIQGRGWDGFSEVRSLDSRNGFYDSRYFLTSFPYTGMQYEELVSNGSQNISEFLGTQVATTLSSSSYQQRYFPYWSNVTRQQWELGGVEAGDLITTVSTNYSYDNYGNATTIAATTTDNDPGSPYHGDTWTATTTNTTDPSTSPWCLNLFTQTQVAYTASVGNAVTRTKQFTPDLTNCRYTQVVTEPSSSTYKVTEALGYDAFGNVNSDTVTGVGMAARPSSINWGTTGQFPMSVTDPSGAQSQFNYNFSYGKLSSITDPNNLTTSWQYSDGFGRVNVETLPDGTSSSIVWSWCLTSCGYSYSQYEVADTSKDSGGGTIRVDTKMYDGLDREIYSSGPSLTGAQMNVLKTYNAMGLLAQQSMPYQCCSATVYWQTFTYDSLNRPTQVQRPISASNSTLQTTSYAYAGRTTTVTDPLSNQTTLISDVNGWQRQTKDPLSYVVTFGYDAAGARTAVSDSLSNTLWSGSYAYGLKAFLTAETDMDRGSWGYTVDAVGERTAWTDAKGQSFSMTYDPLSRPSTRTEPDLFTQWQYGSTPASHNVGQLISACTGTGSSCSSSAYAESRTFDTDGRLSQRTITLNGTSYTYGFAYNSEGQPGTLTYPTGTGGYALEVQYGYSNGLLSSVADVPDNVTIWTANAQNAAGQITQETLGNGVVANHTYDAVTHWLSAVTAGVAGGTGLQNLSYLYDEAGNVTQRQDNNLGLTENDYYDTDYRLTSIKVNGTARLGVSYDAMGDITARSDVASGATWTYDPSRKHAVTQAGSSSYVYAYDANGNATSRQGSTIGWSSYNYPVNIGAGTGSRVENVVLSYGPDRSRWQQVYTGHSTTQTTQYIGGLLEAFTTSGTTTFKYYVYAGSEPIAVLSPSTSGTTINYLRLDNQGGVQGIDNSSGTMVVNESYAPFGARRDPTTWVGVASNTDLTTSTGITAQGYTFQTQLGLWMGLNHMKGRVQDDITGRFLSADPSGVQVNNSQSFNRYSYVANNPLTFADPTGFCPQGSFLNMGDGQCMQEVDVTAQAITCDSICKLAMQASLSQYIMSADLNLLVNQISNMQPLVGPGGGGGSGEPAGGKSNSSSPPPKPKTTPCTGVGGAIQDFTGGQSNQSAVDDIADNYVNTKSFGIDNVVDNTFGTHIAGNVPQIANPGVQTAIMLGGGAGVVAQAWGGQTLFQATWLAARGASLGLNVPYAALGTTGGVSFALGYLVKGTYSAGILAGSIIRTGANRLASALCTRQ